MAIYLNPGINSFEEEINSEIYVDKTGMISYVNSVVNTKQKFMSISRPRRFGKSYAVDMLCAYYGRSDKEEYVRKLFESRKISECEDWDKYLGRFNVIRLVMTDFIKRGKSLTECLDRMQKLVIRDIKAEYPDADLFDEDDMIQVMNDVYSYSETKFVIIIDEWDAIFRERKDADEEQKEYLDFLRDWLKGKDYIALAYMTGILPIKKYGKHSALNMFDEYSMISASRLTSYTGFTGDDVRELCTKYNMDYDVISDWYDGYRLRGDVPVSERIIENTATQLGSETSIYNPLSVVSAITNGVVENYWNKTETYEALAEYIRADFDGLKESVAVLMAGGRVKVNIGKYQNDMQSFVSKDDILSLLIHLGYLGYDKATEKVFIPNKEILEEFKNSTDDNVWVDTFRSFKASLKLLDAIWLEDESKVAEFIEDAHDRTSNKTYNDEAALSYGIQYAMYAAQKYYTTIQELDSGKGYADIVYLPSPKYPDKPALLMELKYNKNVKTASAQVRERNYPQILQHYAGNIIIVSINYDKDARSTDANFKHHSCKIEKV